MASNVTKVSVALGSAELVWARKRSRQDRTSVSAVLTEAARRMAEQEARLERQRAAWAALEDWLLDGTPASAEELDAARRELDRLDAAPVSMARGRAKAPRSRQGRVA